MQRVQPLPKIGWLQTRSMITIIGSFVSPYVRKVLACLNLKGLAYEVDPITPFFGNDEFERLSPLRRIPVLIDGDFSISDSIGDLRLSRRGLSRPPAVPRRRQGPRPRPLARGICRHAARRRVHLGLLLPEDRAPAGVGGAGRRGADRESASERIFPPRSTISSRNCRRTASCSARSASPTSPSRASSATALMRASRSTPRAGRAPQAFVERTLAHPALAALLPFEDVQRSAEIKGRRQALLDAGAPLTAETMGLRAPKRGMMRLERCVQWWWPEIQCSSRVRSDRLDGMSPASSRGCSSSGS